MINIFYNTTNQAVQNSVGCPFCAEEWMNNLDVPWKSEQWKQSIGISLMKAWWKECSINVKQPQILSDSNIYSSLNVIVQRRQSVQTHLQWDSLSLDSVTILEGAHYSDSPFWTCWFLSQGLNIFLQNDPLINCHLESLHCRITIISTQIYWLI